MKLIFCMLLTATVCLADMGQFATIAQNPVPLEISMESSDIELLAENVVIELVECDKALITATFLFRNTGADQQVIMYFPVSVLSPQISALWQLEVFSLPFETPAVTVNSNSVEVFPLQKIHWSPERTGLSWNDVTSIGTPFPPDEPPPNGSFFLRVHDYIWGVIPMLSLGIENEADMLALSTEEFLSAWTVNFRNGEEILVEYSHKYHLSTSSSGDYTVYYPLYTGSGWLGSIGEGEISVVPCAGFSWKTMIEWSSLSMPEGVQEEEFTPQPSPLIMNHESYETTVLSRLVMNTYDTAIVWRFTDFEPVITPSEWMAFYPIPSDWDADYVYDNTGRPPGKQYASALRVVFTGPGIDW